MPGGHRQHKQRVLSELLDNPIYTPETDEYLLVRDNLKEIPLHVLQLLVQMINEKQPLFGRSGPAAVQPTIPTLEE